MKTYHKPKVDSQGNYRDKGRDQEGYLRKVNDDIPFPALVTAWYPKSQTIDVARPVQNGIIEYDSVIVYGGFFDSIGTIHTPDIATEKKEFNYTLARDSNSDKADPTSEKYVLNNHIEALVFKISVGNTFAFASNSFRFVNPDSVLLNNAKKGRRITRLSDGSYYIHDSDGNIQLRHPSGLNLRIGDSTTDIDLDIPFPSHGRNSVEYGGEIAVKLDHPSGTNFEVTKTGTLNASSVESINLEAIDEINLDAPNVNITNNLIVGAMIKAVGDIIADWMSTAVAILTHFHPGNLGFNTGTGMSSGGVSTPPSPLLIPSDLDLQGNDIFNIKSQTVTNFSTHSHSQDPDGAENIEQNVSEPL